MKNDKILCIFPYNSSFTKYQGVYVKNNGSYIKVLDFIGIGKGKEGYVLKSEINGREIIIKKSKVGVEALWIKDNLIFYEFFPNKKMKENTIILDFDHRPIKEFPTWGRNYKCIIRSKSIKVEYNINSNKLPSVIIAIGDQKEQNINERGWIEKKYVYDEIRNSLYDLWVYRLEVKKNAPFRVVIGIKDEEESEINIEKKVVFNYSIGKWYRLKEIKNALDKEEKKLRTIENCIKRNKKISGTGTNICEKDILKLVEITKNDVYKSLIKFIDENRLYAGFPYFVEEWYRDELISLHALLEHEVFLGVVKKLLLRTFNIIKDSIERGSWKITNYSYGSSNASLCCDSIFYFYSLIKEFIEKKGIKKDKDRLRFNIDEFKEIAAYLPKFIEILEKEGMEKIGMPLPYCEGKETWMDTIDRKGIVSEISLLYLDLYDMLLLIKKNERFRDVVPYNMEDLEEKYRRIASKIKELFFDKNMDYYPGGDVFRPNIILGLYFTLELFPKKDIEKVIDEIIKRCWIKWGGISTIDIHSNLFIDKDDGELNKSYHSGNVWYFLNNIFAIIMLKTNPDKYAPYIMSILHSSIKDFYFKGFYKDSSEVSSAFIQEARGCLAQLWSEATLYNLLDEIMRVCK